MATKSVGRLSLIGPAGILSLNLTISLKHIRTFQVDIVAVNSDDLRVWKGSVESRSRQLALKIEQDTHGMLQCHPYPNECVDTSKQCAHCAFFMGLQRKQGVRVQGGQQFDIRGTVEEFRHSVNMYMYWKPGMEIYVSHVRRRQIPSFVFPEGFKRSRPSKPTNQQKSERAGGEEGDDEVAGGSPEKRLKRKRSPDEEVGKQQLEKRLFVSPDHEKLSSPEPGSGGLSELGSGGSGVSIKVDRSPDNMQHAVAELDKSPTLISPGSGKQILPVSETGLCERVLSGNGESCEGVNSQDCVLAGIQETVLEATLLGSERIVENGLAVELEPNASLGVVLKGRSGVVSESVQKPVIRLSLTSTA